LRKMAQTFGRRRGCLGGGGGGAVKEKVSYPSVRRFTSDDQWVVRRKVTAAVHDCDRLIHGTTLRFSSGNTFTPNHYIGGSQSQLELPTLEVDVSLRSRDHRRNAESTHIPQGYHPQRRVHMTLVGTS